MAYANFFWTAFKIFSTLVLSSLTMTCLNVDFFVFFLPLVLLSFESADIYHSPNSGNFYL